MANPFDKYLKEEDLLQIAVTRYLQLQHPEMKYHHSPNEGKRTPFVRYLIGLLGVKSGFPDLVIFYKGYNMALELKVKKNFPTQNQWYWLNLLEGNGWYSQWANSQELAIKHIEDFKIWVDGKIQTNESPESSEGNRNKSGRKGFFAA